MVNALVKLDQNTNRVLNIVKAKYGLKDKSEAIEFVVDKFIKVKNEPDLLPEFIKKIKEIKKQKGILVNDFSKRYGLE